MTLVKSKSTNCQRAFSLSASILTQMSFLLYSYSLVCQTMYCSYLIYLSMQIKMGSKCYYSYYYSAASNIYIYISNPISPSGDALLESVMHIKSLEDTGMVCLTNEIWSQFTGSGLTYFRVTLQLFLVHNKAFLVSV